MYVYVVRRLAAAGKSEFHFSCLVFFYSALYYYFFARALANFHFSLCTSSCSHLQPDQSYQTNRQPTLPSPFAHSHTHTLTLTGTRGHPKSSCLPAACQFINALVCVCVHEFFTHTHTHTHAQTEASTLRHTKIVIFTFYAEAALFSRMRLKNLLRSSLTILLVFFCFYSRATFQLLFKLITMQRRRYPIHIRDI